MTGAPEGRGHVDRRTQLGLQLTCFRIRRVPGGRFLQILLAPQRCSLGVGRQRCTCSFMLNSLHSTECTKLQVYTERPCLYSPASSPSSSMHPLGGARVTSHRENVHAGHSSNCSFCQTGHPGWRNSLAPRQGHYSPPVASEMHLALFSHTR